MVDAWPSVSTTLEQPYLRSDIGTAISALAASDLPFPAECDKHIPPWPPAPDGGVSFFAVDNRLATAQKARRERNCVILFPDYASCSAEPVCVQKKNN